MTETPSAVLSRFTEAIILYCAMNSASAGSICTSRIASTKLRRPRKRKREIASAARNANAMQTTSVIAVMTTDQPRALRKPDWNSTAWKLATEPPNGRKVGVRAVSVLVGKNDELIIQYTGNAQSIASTIAPAPPSQRRTVEVVVMILHPP